LKLKSNQPSHFGPVTNPVERYKTLQDEIIDLMKMWHVVNSYNEKCFITRRISALQNEAIVALRQARFQLRDSNLNVPILRIKD